MVNWLIGKSVAGDMRSTVENINAYLVDGPNVYVEARKDRLQPSLPAMIGGNMPYDGGNLTLTEAEMKDLTKDSPESTRFIKPFIMSTSAMSAISLYCLWITDNEKGDAEAIPQLRKRMEGVARARLASCTTRTHPYAKYPHRFYQAAGITKAGEVAIPVVLSENRKYIPAILAKDDCVMGDSLFFLRGDKISPSSIFSITSSRCHMVWAEAVGGRRASGVRYSNTLIWNTFPAPRFTETDERHLENAANVILSRRRAEQNKTLGQLYACPSMPQSLKESHVHNDSVTDKIILGKECQSDKERLSLLLAKYQEMTEPKPNNAPTLQSLF